MARVLEDVLLGESPVSVPELADLDSGRVRAAGAYLVECREEQRRAVHVLARVRVHANLLCPGLGIVQPGVMRGGSVRAKVLEDAGQWVVWHGLGWRICNEKRRK